MIKHPKGNQIPCELRSGCPVMDRKAALDLLDYMEKNPQVSYELSDDDRRWWENLFPQAPTRSSTT